jgi:hypothetical protein
MNEWDKKYREKISRGYKDTTNVTPPSNWIQGMSVAQRKKQGITTVQPLVQSKKVKKKPKVIKKTAKANHSHMKKLRILHMTMHLWEKNNGQVPIDSRMGRMYEADLHKVEKLVDEGLSKKVERGKEFLTKEEMLDMNILFKTYGGKRVTE